MANADLDGATVPVVFTQTIAYPNPQPASTATQRAGATPIAVSIPAELLARYEQAMAAASAVADEVRVYEQQADRLRVEANRARYEAEQARAYAAREARIAAFRAEQQALEDRLGKAEWVIVTKRSYNHNTGRYRDTGDTLHHESCAIVSKVRAKYEEHGEGTHATNALRPDEAVARCATRYENVKSANVTACRRCNPTVITVKADAYLAAGIRPDEIRQMEKADGPIPLDQIQALAALRGGTHGRLDLAA